MKIEDEAPNIDRKILAIMWEDAVPKLEPKQETLEEAAENIFDDFKSKNPIVPQKNILPFKSGFIAGAKWQAERMYSEEEVLELLRKSHFVEQNIEEWFEQHKKK
jgi:hypothetical protein